MSLFFELLLVSLGKREKLSACLNEKDWELLFLMAIEQTLVGVLFHGIELLPNEQRPPKELLMRWYALCEQIKAVNDVANKKTLFVANYFKHLGLLPCILKGQGNALLYPTPSLRISGDVDIWLWPKNDINKSLSWRRNKITTILKTKGKVGQVVYHHADFQKWDDIDIEVHYTPTWLQNPVYNRRLQLFFEEMAESSFSNTKMLMDNRDICVPVWEMNVVFQLIHMQHHLFQEGIGLRQVMDFYYLIKDNNNTSRSTRHLEMIDALGLKNFTSAIMWVLKNKFCIEEELLLTAPNGKLGQFLLTEIIAGGNFGKYHKHSNNKLKQYLLGRAFLKIKKGLLFFEMNKWEVACLPFFKVWHYFWRKLANRKGTVNGER